MMRHSVKLAAFAVIGLLSAHVTAADKEIKVTSDNDFLIQAATCGDAEVKFSEMAVKQTGNENVKAFAQRLVKDHKDLNEKLAEKAKGSKLSVVVGAEKKTRAECEKLAKLQGSEFDREFLKQIVNGHERAIKLFEYEAKNGTSDELKTFASDTIPTMKTHLKEAREWSEKIN